MRWLKYVGGFLGIILLIVAFNLFSTPEPRILPRELPYSSFLDQLQNDQVASVTLAEKVITGKLKNGESFMAYIPSADLAVPVILSKHVPLSIRPLEEDIPSLLGVIVSWLPFLVFILAFWWFVSRPLAVIAQRLQSLESTVSNAGNDIEIIPEKKPV